MRVVEREVDDAFGRMSRAFGSLVGGGVEEILMHKWIKACETRQTTCTSTELFKMLLQRFILVNW